MTKLERSKILVHLHTKGNDIFANIKEQERRAQREGLDKLYLEFIDVQIKMDELLEPERLERLSRQSSK